MTVSLLRLEYQELLILRRKVAILEEAQAARPRSNYELEAEAMYNREIELKKRSVREALHKDLMQRLKDGLISLGHNDSGLRRNEHKHGAIRRKPRAVRRKGRAKAR